MNALFSFEGAVVSHRFERAVLRAKHFACHGEDRTRAPGISVYVMLPAKAQHKRIAEFSFDYVGRKLCVDGHLTTMVPGFECAALRAEHFVCIEEDRSRAVEIPFGVVLPLEAQPQKVSGHSPDAVGRIHDDRSSLRRSSAIFPGHQHPNTIGRRMPGNGNSLRRSLVISQHLQHPDTVGMNLSHQFAYRSGGSVRKLVLEACRCHCYRSTLSPRHANTALNPCEETLLVNQLPIISKKSDSITSKNYYH